MNVILKEIIEIKIDGTRIIRAARTNFLSLSFAVGEPPILPNEKRLSVRFRKASKLCAIAKSHSDLNENSLPLPAVDKHQPSPKSSEAIPPSILLIVSPSRLAEILQFWRCFCTHNLWYPTDISVTNRAAIAYPLPAPLLLLLK